MAISNSKKAAPKSKAAPKAEADKCAECCAKIVSLEKEVNELKSQLSGLLTASDAIDKVKSEVSELKEKAKSWKEKADTNHDGKLDFEEIYAYVCKRMSDRFSAPKKGY